jgi:hypothetical protein
VEFVGLGIGGRWRTEGAIREEERKNRRETTSGGMGRIRVCECVKEASGSKDEIRLLITARISFLAIQNSGMDRENARISLVRIIDVGWVTERSLGVEEVIRAGGERNPFAFRRKLGKVGGK